jgi:hypothetical protein
MKLQLSDSALLDTTTILFIVLLIAAGSALLLGSGAGLLSLDQMAKFWPVTLVATGLVELLSEPERNA